MKCQTPLKSLNHVSWLAPRWTRLTFSFGQVGACILMRWPVQLRPTAFSRSSNGVLSQVVLASQ